MAEGFRGMDQLLDDMRNLPDELKGEAAKHIATEANATEMELRHAYARVTGNLIRGVGQQKLSPLHINVRSRAPHAILYEYGSYKSGERFWKKTSISYRDAQGRFTKAKSKKWVRATTSGGPHKSTGTMPAARAFSPIKWRHIHRLDGRFMEMFRRMKVRGMTGSAL